jgi:hypothetical protein
MTTATPKPQATPAPSRSSSQHTRLKDFSVESQRRTFIAEQERERAAAETRRSSRRINKQAANGPINRLDDDDSVGSCSVGSEESFYVGIERADYTSPDNLEMYGHSESREAEQQEDRLGIVRVSKAWRDGDDASGVIVHEESSSLYSFMTGSQGANASPSAAKKDVLVARPLVVNGIHYKQKGQAEVCIEEEHSQVYQQEAAEGKMFINKLVQGGNSSDDASTVAEMVHQTPAKKRLNTPFTTPGTTTTSRGGGHYPIISPMALFSPYIPTSTGEDNTQRQLRERQIRKDAESEAKIQYDAKMAQLKNDFRIFLLRSCTAENGFPVSELKRQMDEFMKINA